MNDNENNSNELSLEEMETGLELLGAQNTLSDFIDILDERTVVVREFFANYRCAAYETETKFKVLNERFSVRYDSNPIEAIKVRIKSPESILKKMDRKNIEISLQSIEENIRDIAGVRVICSFIDDIYKIADYFLAQDDVELIEVRDYIKNPKATGYRSLHLIVRTPIFTEKGKKMMFVEVQLRTIAMDFWASLEHKLRYKKNLPDELVREIGDELTDCAYASAELDKRMQLARDKMEMRKK
jgi:putative GTP pyrophosphokinase